MIFEYEVSVIDRCENDGAFAELFNRFTVVGCGLPPPTSIIRTLDNPIDSR